MIDNKCSMSNRLSLYEWLIQYLNNAKPGARWLSKNVTDAIFAIDWPHGLSSDFVPNPMFHEWAMYKDSFDNRGRALNSNKTMKGSFRSALTVWLENAKCCLELLSADVTGTHPVRIYRIYGKREMLSPNDNKPDLYNIKLDHDYGTRYSEVQCNVWNVRKDHTYYTKSH